MKLEIYNLEKEGEKEDEEKVTRLALLYDTVGEVTLTAVDEDGKRLPQGDLLYIKPNGTFERASSVNQDLGFQLEDDKIQLEGE